MEDQEALELAEYDSSLDRDDFYRMEEFAKAYAEGQAAIAELEVAKQVLALAISKLPKQQLKLSVTEQTKLHELALQQKLESQSGAIVFRAVRSGN